MEMAMGRCRLSPFRKWSQFRKDNNVRKSRSRGLSLCWSAPRIATDDLVPYLHEQMFDNALLVESLNLDRCRLLSGEVGNRLARNLSISIYGQRVSIKKSCKNERRRSTGTLRRRGQCPPSIAACSLVGPYWRKIWRDECLKVDFLKETRDRDEMRGSKDVMNWWCKRDGDWKVEVSWKDIWIGLGW